MEFDSHRMLLGFVLMFLYSTIMLGRLNRVESREDKVIYQYLM